MQRKLIAALAATLSLSALAAPEQFELDSTHTYPSFEISHLGFSPQRGFFKETEGTLTLDRAAKTGSIEATIKAASIETGFGKRDEHLRKPDFFNVEKHPTLTFKAQDFKFDGENPVEASGSLTMLGVTKPVVLKIQPMKCDKRGSDQKFVCGGDVTTTIKRSEWGMKTFLPFIGDEVKISIQVEAMKK